MFAETCIPKYGNKLTELISQHKAVVLSSDNCVYCNKAKKLLDTQKVAYHEIALDKLHPNDSYEIVNCVFGRPEYYVPYIFYEKQRLGGFGELRELHNKGKLE